MKRGFIALISSTMLCAVLLLALSTTSMSGFFTRAEAFDEEARVHTDALLHSCAHTALLALVTTHEYSGEEIRRSGEEIRRSGDETCTIVVTQGSPVEVLVSATAYKHTASLVFQFSTTTLEVVSWQHL